MNIKTWTCFQGIVLLLAAHLQLYASENRYCVNGLTQHLEMDDFYYRDETIIPRALDDGYQKLSNPTTCRWVVGFRKSKLNLQVVLEAVPSQRRSTDSAATSEANMLIDMQGKSNTSVTAGMFLVVPVKELQKFSVEMTWDRRTQRLGSENLRIILPIPRLCHRDMLGFNGSCYSVSPFEQNVTAAMSSIGGDAQLASFSSMAEIRQFIAANAARLQEIPYQRPLNLSQPVRLGMFLRANDAAVLSVVRNDSGCQLLPAQNSSSFSVPDSVTGPCLTLRVAEQDRPVLEFADCSSPMLSLLSFPETASSVPSSAHCTGRELENQVQQLQSLATMTTGQMIVWESGNSTARKLVIIFACVIVVLAAVVSGCLVSWWRFRRHLKSNRRQTRAAADSTAPLMIP